MANVTSDSIRRAHGESVPKRPPRKLNGRLFQKGNKAGVKHGAYASSFVQPEEKERFLAVRQEVAREIKRELGPDTIMLDMAALLVIRHGLALQGDQMKIANETLVGILNILDRLQATRKSRAQQPVQDTGPSECEQVSELLAEAKKQTGPDTTPGEIAGSEGEG